ncbi:MAG: hypothetical protein HY687_00350 [Chloroflexi bacterium]|nr:hypothetical protein [Chloroflexota bacterium]
MFDNLEEPIQTLISFREVKLREEQRSVDLVDMVLTPVRPDQRVPQSLNVITQLQYEKFDSGVSGQRPFIVTSGNHRSVANNPWGAANMVERVFSYSRGTQENGKVMRLLKDMQAHEAINGGVFVTEDKDALAFRDWIQGRIGVFILSVSEAFDYLDVYLKKHGKYLYRPHYSANKKLYYWYRLCELVPVFQKTWTASAAATQSLPSGEQVQGYLHSLYTRLLYMLEIKDRIASHFYARADNEVQHDILRELNYFMVLTTGTFDALAWVMKYYYNFCPTDSEDTRFRQSITLKLPPKKQSNKLITHVERQNSSLGEFLRSAPTQNLIGIFYPARDSIQHRHPLRGIQYIRSKIRAGRRDPIQAGAQDTAYSLAILDPDTMQAISEVDSDDPSDYFTLWGVRTVDEWTFLEPYKFVVQALRTLFAFYGEILRLLNIGGCDSLTRSDLDKIESLIRAGVPQHQRFTIPFLLNRTLPPVANSIPRLPGDILSPTQLYDSVESNALFGTCELFIEFIRR